MGDDRQKARNAGMIEEAKAFPRRPRPPHAAGKHGISEARAKAAKYLAEQVSSGRRLPPAGAGRRAH
jgi:hypothetical protein